VRLTFLGRSSENGESPTLYATDRDTYIVQGYVVTEDDRLNLLDLSADETVVEVYADLFAYLVEDGVAGTVSRWAPPVVHVRENGNYLVQGIRLTDQRAREEMAIPDHEDAVEVSKAAVLALVEGATCN
jgi:hypothetical protein